MIKDAIIIGLVGYIFFDRYLREKKMDLLAQDIRLIKSKAENFYDKLQEPIPDDSKE